MRLVEVKQSEQNCYTNTGHAVNGVHSKSDLFAQASILVSQNRQMRKVLGLILTGLILRLEHKKVDLTSSVWLSQVVRVVNYLLLISNSWVDENKVITVMRVILIRY